MSTASINSLKPESPPLPNRPNPTSCLPDYYNLYY